MDKTSRLHFKTKKENAPHQACRLTFRKPNQEQNNREQNNQEQDNQEQRKKLTLIPKQRLKLQITRNCCNSPFLSIQKFIKEEIKEKGDISIQETTQIWEKYKKQSRYAVIIEKHEIDFYMFLEIYHQIMNTQEHLQEIDSKFYRSSKEEMELIVL